MRVKMTEALALAKLFDPVEVAAWAWDTPPCTAASPRPTCPPSLTTTTTTTRAGLVPASTEPASHDP